MLLNLHNEKEKIVWTNHVKDKMRYYKLSAKQVLRILRRPGRREEGIAPGTAAAMQKTGTKKNPKEIWTMYQASEKIISGKKYKKLKIISAWRYPGVTPVGERPQIPQEVLFDLETAIKENDSD
jgi:hypothetical protein